MHFCQRQPNGIEIRELSRSFTFGNQMRVRNNGLGSELSAFVFGTTAENSKLEGDGETTVHSFANFL